MRKFDRNAVFNIIVKILLFVLMFTGTYFLMCFIFGAGVLISIAVCTVSSLAVVVLFSFLLRYTGFYFGYYAFVSGFLFRYKTGEVYCPCCDKHFPRFRDERFYADEKRFNPEMFSSSRQDVICDFCRSAPRHRIIAKWAEQNIELLKKSEILYFAPELSMSLWFRRHGIHVRTADLFDKRAELKLDITALDLPDASVDVVFCNHILEHVSDYRVALSELHRVIRKDGVLIISFPIDYASEGVREEDTGSVRERISLFGQYDHLRVFGNDSRKILENAGFKTDAIDISQMPDEIVPVSGPADYDTNEIFCCIRK